jgi:hypothetical protein
MEGIRPYTPDDADQAIRLYQRMFLDDRTPEPNKREFLDWFFSKGVLQSPWRRDGPSSLVYENTEGLVAGFLGVIPRELYFRGRRIRVAIANNFMVDPAFRPASIALMRSLLSGSQDLTIPDGATYTTRLILERLGFRVYPSMSVNWVRVFRRSLAVLAHLTRAATPYRRLLAKAARPIGQLIDNSAGRIPALETAVEGPTGVRSRPLDVSELLDCIEAVSRSCEIRPAYDEGSLQRVLNLYERARYRGRLVRVAVVDDQGGLLGWYLCLLMKGGISEIIQIGAFEGRMEVVLKRALYDCMRWGVALVFGRLEMTYLEEALVNECVFRPGPWMLAHARDTAITDALDSGEIFLSGLEQKLPWW